MASKDNWKTQGRSGKSSSGGSNKTDSDWSSGKIESTLEEISLRVTDMRHSWMS